MIEGILIGLKTALSFQNLNDGDDWLFCRNNYWNACQVLDQ